MRKTATSLTLVPVLLAALAAAAPAHAQQADLSLTKTGAPSPVLQGGVVTYGYTIANAGPQAATNVRLHDVLPAGTEFEAFEPVSDGGVCVYSFTPRALECLWSSVAPGATVTAGLALTANEAGVLVNTASVTSETADPDGANNSSTATVLVSAPQADLSLTKTGSPAAIVTGDTITYSYTIANAGPQAATNVRLHDVLPAGTEFEAFEPVSGGGVCVYSFTPRALECLWSSVAPGATVTAGMRLVAHEAGALVNTANVTSDTGDPDGTNNSSTATVLVNPPQADLSLTKTGAPSPVLVGGVVTYAYAIANAGPQAATNVRLHDVLPAGTEFEAFEPVSDGGVCVYSFTPRALECLWSSVAPGATVTAGLRLTVNEVGQLLNTANVTSETGDPVATNDSATAGVFVRAELPSVDTTPPTCMVPTAIIAGPPKRVQATVQDTGMGLVSVEAVSLKNATLSVPYFAPGSDAPVVVTFEKVDQALSSAFTIRITDAAGNVTECDPAVAGDVTEFTGGTGTTGCSHAPASLLALVAVGLVALRRRARR